MTYTLPLNKMHNVTNDLTLPLKDLVQYFYVIWHLVIFIYFAHSTDP